MNALRAEGATLREAVHAEWTKLRTVPSTGWLLLTLIALTVGAGALATAVVKCPASCDEDTTKLSLTGILLGQAAVAVLAVLVMSGEYSNGMIQVTLTAVPRRATALAAKAIILTGVVLAAGAVSVLGSVLAGRFILPGNGFTKLNGALALSLGDGPTLRAAAGSVLYLALIGLFSLGLATALRDSGASIAVMLGLLYIVPLLTDLGTLDPRWEHRLQQWGPMTAGLAIQATKDLKKLPIGPWQGLGVLAAWAAAALLAGGLLLRLRDA
jgi:ABC-2 type transport system permease protein